MEGSGVIILVFKFTLTSVKGKEGFPLRDNCDDPCKRV